MGKTKSTHDREIPVGAQIDQDKCCGDEGNSATWWLTSKMYYNEKESWSKHGYYNSKLSVHNV